MERRPASAALDQVRAARVRPPRDESLRDVMTAAEAAFSRAKKGTAGVQALWVENAPRNLLACSRVKGLARGVLTIEVTDEAARFLADRFLRSGGEAVLVRGSRVAIKRVKVVVA